MRLRELVIRSEGTDECLNAHGLLTISFTVFQMHTTPPAVLKRCNCVVEWRNGVLFHRDDHFICNSQFTNAQMHPTLKPQVYNVSTRHRHKNRTPVIRQYRRLAVNATFGKIDFSIMKASFRLHCIGE